MSGQRVEREAFPAVFTGCNAIRADCFVLHDQGPTVLEGAPLKGAWCLLLWTLFVQMLYQLCLRSLEPTPALKIDALPLHVRKDVAKGHMSRLDLRHMASACRTRLVSVQGFLNAGTAEDVARRAVRLNCIFQIVAANWADSSGSKLLKSLDSKGRVKAETPDAVSRLPSAVLNRARPDGMTLATVPSEATEIFQSGVEHSSPAAVLLEEEEMEGLSCPANSLMKAWQFKHAIAPWWSKLTDSKEYNKILKHIVDGLLAFHATDSNGDPARMSAKFDAAFQVSEYAARFTKKYAGPNEENECGKPVSVKKPDVHLALTCAEKWMIDVIMGSIPIPRKNKAGAWVTDPMTQRINDWWQAIEDVRNPTALWVQETWLLGVDQFFSGKLAAGGFAMLMACNTASEEGLSFAKKFICEGGYDYVGGHVNQLDPTDMKQFTKLFYKAYFDPDTGAEGTFKEAWETAVRNKALKPATGKDVKAWSPAAWYRSTLDQSQQIEGAWQENLHAVVCPEEPQKVQQNLLISDEDEDNGDNTDETELHPKDDIVEQPKDDIVEETADQNDTE
uniref:Uncharacterized protein n=1 Tax=Chromera velia CCMP2878 TaxID=1169474 RepID=A0A0G4I8N7_9ALVE|eukprot:Cvel_1998.t1-p1 / transcript=Cvel_1998.t1 / gene=Cvel_1998 / organism=Chromera_velia_CCMP2878 / gene_product=RING finger protein 151, putative / transcript_product=RING finger protein 151, putative / location=Cvel_scaffold76:66490-70763(+) / protein_length=560 / sequence_SO=supercontig / SO=protein_coding / is_pseudo=false